VVKAYAFAMKNFVWLIPIPILLALSASTQTATPPLSYGPDQKIILDATFEGPGADQVTGGSFCFNLQGARPPSQLEFSSQLCSNLGESKLIPPHTLEMTFTIPKNQAAGDYRLSQISTYDKRLDSVFLYTKDELPNRMVNINNPNTATKPKLKDVQVH
jgi:hypothetical protein